MVELDTDILGDQHRAPAATLLLHGANGDKHQLRELATALNPAVSIRPSLRGYGNSFTPAHGYSPLDHAADLQRSAHRWPAALDVIGYSYGAVVGLVTVATWARDRARSLVVLDTSFAAFPDFYDDGSEGGWLRWTYNYEPILASLDIPVLFLRSQRSHLLTAGNVARIAKHRHVTVHDVPGDHDAIIDQPALLAQLIEGWQR